MNPDLALAISEARDILSNYDLGDLVSLVRNDRGYNNTSYAIETIVQGERKKFFLRRYRIDIQQEELEFEHAIIAHLLDSNLTWVAKIFETKHGTTYCKKLPEDDQDQPVYFAIFEFLPGEDKYTWVNPNCSLLEVKNSASALAQFHHSVADFTPTGRRTEPKILNLLPKIAENAQEVVKLSSGTSFDNYLQGNLSHIVESCKEAQRSFNDLVVSDWLQMVIHCDFHPGNLKFYQEQVVGLFDFDGSKIDLRCFDVALALWYFFTNWKNGRDGEMRLDDCGQFLKTYQLTLAELPDLYPLDRSELQHLPVMINLSNLYVLNWTLTDYYAKDVDDEEYLVYLKHSVNFIRWFARIGQDLLVEKINYWNFMTSID